jgi:hypothetical protein
MGGPLVGLRDVIQGIAEAVVTYWPVLLVLPWAGVRQPSLRLRTTPEPPKVATVP